MLAKHQRRASLLLLSLCASGCFNLDFGPGEPIEACSSIDPEDVAMALQDRYALGATRTFSLTGLRSPTITSSVPDVVSVGPIQEGRVTLSFVAEGSATIIVSEANDTGPVYASATVEVAKLERFEVVLPFTADADPPLQLAGRALIDPAFQVLYFDHEGRLYGRGLAETSWESAPGADADVFFNDSLAPGPHEVEVRVGNRTSVIPFEAVAHAQVESLAILETDPDENGRVQVDLVGLTAAGTQVWNLFAVFVVEGATEWYGRPFEYIFDPDAPPSTVLAYSIHLTNDDGSPLDPVETTIHRVEPEHKAHYATVAIPPRKGRAPLIAIFSLLMMTVAVRASVSVRPRFRAPRLKPSADTPS